MISTPDDASAYKRAEKVYKRHKRIWKFFWHIAKPVFKILYNYTSDLAPDIDGPCLILANHNCNLDPVLVGLSFKRQMYFVASEHVYRHGFISKVLFWAFEPIAKMKGMPDTMAVMKAIRALKSGKNVCLFPEGNRSFNGRTGPIFDATGKLVKTSGATLITYKIEGGYFTTPRWAKTSRKGYCHGSVVKIYSPEELKQMDASQVTECIRRDLDENAYSRQKSNPIRYKGKKLAEGMECALSVCPKCCEIGSIATKANEVFCKKCGLSTSFNEYSYFDQGFPFHTVEEWDLWQDDFFRTYIEQKKDCETALFSDSDLILKMITTDYEEEIVGKGTLSLYKDRLEFKSDGESASAFIKVLISDMIDISIILRDYLVFSDVFKNHYEVKGVSLKNVRKYAYVCKLIKEKKEI
ncbi:MAG: 1-acyl-sn-glycerol-3-phosphate acyltransferase [Treponema sp.]|nr:1-acyl-sn-glycerol-3-phosphate acyltransferase [Treponema sp.]